MAAPLKPAKTSADGARFLLNQATVLKPAKLSQASTPLKPAKLLIPRSVSVATTTAPPVAAAAGASRELATGQLGLGIFSAATTAELKTELRRQLTQTSSGKLCTLSRSCKKYGCALWHPGGRDVEEDPSGLFCYFGRQCSKSHCSYLHVAGRELDEDPVQVCPIGAACATSTCKLRHPYNRTFVNPLWCFTCHQPGHTRQECMHDAPCYVQIGAFPGKGDLEADGCDALLNHVSAELQAFGELASPPKLISGKAVARFADARFAQHAVEALSTFGFEIDLCKQPLVKLQVKVPQPEIRDKSCTVFIGNLSFDTKESDLQELFGRCGRVVEVRIPQDKDTKRKGYAFCDFAEKESALKAIADLHGEDIKGRRIRVTCAERSLGEVATAKETILTISGFPGGWLEHDVVELLKGSINDIYFRNVKISPCDDKGTGSAKVSFSSWIDGQRAWSHLNERKISGKSLTFALSEDDASNGSVDGIGFKTEMCKAFIAGACEYGERCIYAHSAEEKRTGSPARDKACTVFIGNVPQNASEADLNQVFGEVGKIVFLRMIKGKDGCQKGFGFCQYELEKAAKVACEKLHGTDFRGRRLKVNRASRALGEVMRTTLHISGFPLTWHAPEVESFLRSASPLGALGVTVLEPVGDFSLGCAKVTFECLTQAHQVSKEFHGKEIDGEPLSIFSGPLQQKKKTRDSKGGKTMVIHLDELNMPHRPDFKPCSADREVWVGAMPDEEDLDEWLSIFGEVEEVFRLSDEDTGELGRKGYVVFKEHGSAANCVAVGSGTWSESERALTSQTCPRWQGRPSAYPRNFISLLLGSRGEAISKLKADVGASTLSLRGEGLGSSDESKSTRLHFLFKGSRTARSKLQCALESQVAEVHAALKEKVENPDERRSRSRRRNQTRPQQSPDDDGPWRPPEMRPPEMRPPEMRPPEMRPPEMRPPEMPNPAWNHAWPPMPGWQPPPPPLGLHMGPPPGHWPHMFDPRLVPPEGPPPVCGIPGYGGHLQHPASPPTAPGNPQVGQGEVHGHKRSSSRQRRRRARSGEDIDGEHRRRRHRRRHKPSNSLDRSESNLLGANPYL
eukprot:TRINITY_DN14051_c0_g1_i1.p1 TRINITY_DN14051_c0_g1~~TRINITY_DN14051_c0_g1_i1.p1  ORF type:complete len:1098 (-),score=124.70 TRINITY_DN14051_c0_g1_i1:28-3258(-)